MYFLYSICSTGYERATMKRSKTENTCLSEMANFVRCLRREDRNVEERVCPKCSICMPPTREIRSHRRTRSDMKVTCDDISQHLKPSPLPPPSKTQTPSQQEPPHHPTRPRSSSLQTDSNSHTCTRSSAWCDPPPCRSNYCHTWNCSRRGRTRLAAGGDGRRARLRRWLSR